MKFNKLQLTRLSSQIIFTILMIFGFYHNASLIFEILLFAGLLFGNFFCGWGCPFGTAQDIMGKIGSLFIKKKLKTPRWLQRYLLFTRYIVFALIIIRIAPLFLYDLNGYTNYLFIVQDIMEDSVQYALGSVIMVSYLVIALIFDRPFCNYLCTEGAKYGLFSLTRLFSIKRTDSACIDCKLCDRACPMNINISNHNHVRNPQCINCLKCVTACPKNGALGYGFIGWKRNKAK